MRFQFAAAARLAPVRSSSVALASLRGAATERALRRTVTARASLRSDLRAGALMFAATFALALAAHLAHAAGIF